MAEDPEDRAAAKSHLERLRERFLREGDAERARRLASYRTGSERTTRVPQTVRCQLRAIGPNKGGSEHSGMPM